MPVVFSRPITFATGFIASTGGLLGAFSGEAAPVLDCVASPVLDNRRSAADILVLLDVCSVDGGSVPRGDTGVVSSHFCWTAGAGVKGFALLSFKSPEAGVWGVGDDDSPVGRGGGLFAKFSKEADNRSTPALIHPFSLYC